MARKQQDGSRERPRVLVGQDPSADTSIGLPTRRVRCGDGKDENFPFADPAQPFTATRTALPRQHVPRWLGTGFAKKHWDYL